MADGALQWGAGSGASHLVSGHLAPHEQLEQEIATFTGFPRALTFSTGYLANLAVTPTFAGRDDAVFSDKLNHASLIDAMQLAKANGADVQRYPHNDMVALEKMLAASSANNKLIVSDAVFSMDGDLAPLPLLFELAERYDAWLVIDDAHGFGVLGPHGKGSLAHFNLPAAPRILLMGTLGKAAGVGGAFVAGSETAIEFLLQRPAAICSPRAAPPAVACALSRSLQIIEHGDAPARQPVRPHRPVTRWSERPAVATAALADRHPAVDRRRQRRRRRAFQRALGARPVGAGDSPADRPERYGAAAHLRFRSPYRRRHRTPGRSPQGTRMTAPLVFLPGWCLGRGPLSVAVDALRGTIIDLPGYGDAPLIKDFDDAVTDIAARLQPGTHLAGWSLGAQLALAIAARAPAKVGKLLLVAGTASFAQRDGWPHAMPPEMLTEFTANVAADVEAMLPRFVGGFNRGDARSKEVTRQLLDLADPRPPAATLAAGLAWLRDVDLRPLAPQIKAPTLLIHGAADPLMPLAAAEALAALIPGARLAAMAECAHAPFISRPADFLALVHAFLHE